MVAASLSENLPCIVTSQNSAVKISNILSGRKMLMSKSYWTTKVLSTKVKKEFNIIEKKIQAGVNSTEFLFKSPSIFFLYYLIFLILNIE